MTGLAGGDVSDDPLCDLDDIDGSICQAQLSRFNAGDVQHIRPPGVPNVRSARNDFEHLSTGGVHCRATTLHQFNGAAYVSERCSQFVRNEGDELGLEPVQPPGGVRWRRLAPAAWTRVRSLNPLLELII